LKYLPELQKALTEQLEILQKGLDVHRKILPENMLKLHETLQVQLSAMKNKTNTLQT